MSPMQTRSQTAQLDLNARRINKPNISETIEYIDGQTIALLDLPTECLINIFEYLPVSDLVRLYKSKFHWKICAIIAQNVIGRKYFKFSEIKHIYSVTEAFKLFGKYFRKIEVGASDLQYQEHHLDKSNEILRLIATYYSPNNLKEISLDVDSRYDSTPMNDQILPIFQNVEKLTLRNYSYNIQEFFLKFVNIISIKLYSVSIIERLPPLTAFPNMKSMSFVDCRIELSILENFLRGGNIIRSFKWNSDLPNAYYDYAYLSRLTQLIADNPPNIEELSLKFSDWLSYHLPRIYLPITELTKLKILELQSFSENILKDFARKNNIQSLAIHCEYYYNMDFDIFANFTSLRSLFIYGLLKNSRKFCLAFLLKLPNLSELCIQYSDIIKQVEILKIVEGQRDLNCLKLLGRVYNFTDELYCELIDIKRHSEIKLEIYLERTQRDLCISNLGENLYQENLISLMPLDN